MAAYSFLNVQAAISGPGGAFSLGSGSGAAEEGITVSMTEDANSMTVGADGEVMHSLHAGKSGSVTVRLLKTSPTNAKLSLMRTFQRENPGAHGQNTLVVTDPTRGDVVTCRNVAFAKAPDLTYAKAGGSVEWTLHAGKIDQILGIGTPSVS